VVGRSMVCTKSLVAQQREGGISHDAPIGEGSCFGITHVGSDCLPFRPQNELLEEHKAEINKDLGISLTMLNDATTSSNRPPGNCGTDTVLLPPVEGRSFSQWR
jgi:hypothetical protein